MKTAEIKAQSEDTFSLSGILDFDTVPTLIPQSRPLFGSRQSKITVDLKNVDDSNSAGVALLITWARWAHQKKKTIHFSNLPSQMRAIMHVSGLDTLLPISD